MSLSFLRNKHDGCIFPVKFGFLLFLFAYNKLIMKRKVIIIAALVAIVLQAEPLDLGISACKSRKDWKFCTPKLELDQAV